MKVEMVSTDSITPYANNARRNKKAIDAVAASLNEFGFRQPIVVDAERVIVVGHTRHAAAVKLGMDEVPVHVAEGLSDDAIRAYRLADNKTAEIAEWDDDKLATELLELAETDIDLEAMGFDAVDVAEMMGVEKEEAKPEVEFSQYIGESNNYIVLLFDNDTDWIHANTLFDLPSVYAARRNGKPWSRGVGRVINGAEAIEKIRSEM